MLRMESTAFLWRGVVAMALGIVAIAWPGITVSALIVLFAIYVFCDAIGHFQHAAASDRSTPVAGHVALALLDIAAGIVALAWPAITVFVLTIWLGIWAVATGVVELGAAFATPSRRGFRIGMVLVASRPEARRMWASAGQRSSIGSNPIQPSLSSQASAQG